MTSPKYLTALSLAFSLTFSLTGLLPIAAAQAQDRVLPNAATPAIPGVVAGGLLIEPVGSGFDGTEGPLGLPDGSLLFTETRAERVIQIKPDKSRAVYLEQTNGANGLALRKDGALVAVQVKAPRVGIIAPAEHAKTLADNYKAAAFVRPNDLVIDKSGGVYFTDSGNNPAADGANQELASTVGIYYLSAKGDLRQLDSEIERPNGIQLSPDEETLYVANTLGQHVLAYDIRSPGKVKNKREFAALAGWKDNSSGADGLAVDDAGRLYVASNAGIEVFTPQGDALGAIPLPVKPQNLAFAGVDKKWLYAVGRGAVYRFPVLTPGVHSRAK
ncbi:MAG: SMP-30/gluconolactonase/LRE family protein [Pseudomonadota bacterium]